MTGSRSDGLAVTVARTAEDLERLEPAWTILQGSSLMTDPDYYRTVLRLDPRVERPYALLLERGGTPAAMALGRFENLPLTCRVGYRTVYEPVARALTIVYGGVLGNEADELAPALLDALCSSLEGREADVLRLANLRTDSRLYATATTRPPLLRRQHIAVEKGHWRLRLPASKDAFLRSLSSRTREGVRRYERRLERDYAGAIEVEVYRDLADLDRLFEQAEAISSKTYQHGLGVEFKSDDLQRGITALAMERGWFRAYVLVLHGEPVAFCHGIGYRGAFRLGIGGYDPAHAHENVGTYVLMRLIEDLCEDGSIEVLDYGFGDAEYKRRFGDERFTEADVLVFAPRPRAVAMNLTRTAILGSAKLAAGALRRAGEFDRVKRAWRRRLQASSGDDIS